jgi:integrase
MPASDRKRKRHTTRYPGVYFRVGRDSKRAYAITWRDDAGKQHWQRVFGDIDAARDELGKRRGETRERRENPQPERPSRTFAEVVEEYKASHDWEDLRPSTRTTYERALRNYALPAFEDTPVGAIDTRAVGDWLTGLRRLERQRGEAKGLKAWTIRGALTALRVVLRFAVSEDYIDHNPVDRLDRRKMPKADQKEKRILDDAELGRLFRAAPERSRLMLQVAAYTGLRSAELRGLVWGDLDLEPGRLTVTRQLDDRDRDRVPPKTPKAKRALPLPPGLVALLRDYKAHLGEWGHAEPGDWVFARDGEGPVPAERFGRDFQAAAKGSRLGPDASLTPHSLRHGYGSKLIAKGCTPVYVSRRMGHANVAITMRVYAHEFEAQRAPEDERTTEVLDAGLAEALAVAGNGTGNERVLPGAPADSPGDLTPA